MPAAGPWAHKEWGGGRISSGTAQATQGKHLGALKSSAKPQMMALPLPIMSPATLPCSPTLPTSSLDTIATLRKGRGGG